MPNDAFKFPDEQEQTNTEEVKADSPDLELEVEVIDDTPAQDRGREPLPKEVVKELEEDELDEYSEKVQRRLKQMKKVWHDERREKERAAREREEALRYAEAIVTENRQLKQKLGTGEKLFVDEMTKAAQTEIATAKDKLRQAYESGDPALIADAQEALTDAKLKLKDYQRYTPTLQAEEKGVEINTEQTQAQPQNRTADPKAEAWRARNTWFGAPGREDMTALAWGLHAMLVQSGVDPSSDEYYRRVDETMRKRFPEAFEDTQTQPTEVEVEKPAPRKVANVVAPATRSTAPKKVRLSQSALALAKRLNLTPEQYAKEVMKLENYNG